MKPGDYPTKMAAEPKSTPRHPVVSARLPPNVYERLVYVAGMQDRSVSSLVRSLIILRLPKD